MIAQLGNRWGVRGRRARPSRLSVGHGRSTDGDCDYGEDNSWELHGVLLMGWRPRPGHWPLWQRKPASKVSTLIQAGEHRKKCKSAPKRRSPGQEPQRDDLTRSRVERRQFSQG